MGAAGRVRESALLLVSFGQHGAVLCQRPRLKLNGNRCTRCKILIGSLDSVQSHKSSTRADNYETTASTVKKTDYRFVQNGNMLRLKGRPTATLFYCIERYGQHDAIFLSKSNLPH